MGSLILNSILSVPTLGSEAISLFDIGLAFVVFIISAVIFNVLIYVFKRATLHITRKTKMALDDKIISAIIKPLRYFSIIVSLLLAVLFIFPSVLDIEVYSFGTSAVNIDSIFVILFVFGFTYLVNNILMALIDWYEEEIAPKTKTTVDNQIIPIIKKVTTIVVYAIGLMIVLDLLGIEIAPLLAGLGIGGLAVALALQDTLSNFFAGMYMLADKPVEKGDYISFDNFEGYVEEISWRNTKIRSWDNNLIILPNTKLSQTTITNYSKPTKPVLRVMKIGVSYDANPEKVIKILYKTTKAIMRKSKVVDPKAEPVVKFSDFKDSSIEFKIIYGVINYTKRFDFEDKLKLEILKTLKKNKIEIPYPITTVYIKEEKSLLEKGSRKTKGRKKR